MYVTLLRLSTVIALDYGNSNGRAKCLDGMDDINRGWYIRHLEMGQGMLLAEHCKGGNMREFSFETDEEFFDRPVN